MSSDLPIITVTSLHDGFANAEQVPDDLPQWWVCPNGHRARFVEADISNVRCLAGEYPCWTSLTPDGPCPFDAVLVTQTITTEVEDRGSGTYGTPSGAVTTVKTTRTATVTDMHHADECFNADSYFITGNGSCRDDALPGQWHLTFKEADR